MSNSDVELINSLLAAHVSAVNAGDVEANLAGFTDDQIYMPPNSPPVRGKSELESLMRAWVDNYAVEIEMEPEETVVSGDWAFQWGVLRGEMRQRESERTTTMDWKFMYVYRREPDGDWKIARDIYNSNVPESGS